MIIKLICEDINLPSNCDKVEIVLIVTSLMTGNLLQVIITRTREFELRIYGKEEEYQKAFSNDEYLFPLVPL